MIPVAVVRDAMENAGLEPVDVARLCGLSDRWALVIRYTLGLAGPTDDTRTHLTQEHALTFAAAIRAVDPATAEHLISAIEEADAAWSAELEAQREAAEAEARSEAAVKALREAEAKAQREAEAKAQREAEAIAQREAEAKAQREAGATIRVGALQTLVDASGAKPEDAARFGAWHPMATSPRRPETTVSVKRARQLAGALVTLARTPYDVMCLAGALADLEDETSVRLVESLPTWDR